jgi:hypothetical protein
MIEVKIVDEELKKVLEEASTDLKYSVDKALYDTLKFVQSDSEQAQILPYDTGNLQNSRKIYVKDGTGYLTHDNAPYSVYIYEGTRHGQPLNFQIKHNAHAQARWYKDYAEGNKVDEVERYFNESLEKHSKII